MRTRGRRRLDRCYIPVTGGVFTEKKGLDQERWGWVTDNAWWKENVLTFLNLMRDSEDTDFLLGYCAHILADIKHNVEIWTPFRIEHEHELLSGQGSALHREAVEVDFELYRTCPDRPRMWELLERAEPMDIPGIVEASDIERARSHLLYKQYHGRKPVDTSAYKYVTVKTMTDFIGEAWREIARQLRLMRLLPNWLRRLTNREETVKY